MVGTGEGWSASTQVLMHVTPDDGLPHLWRGRTYDRYAGAGWISLRENEMSRPVRQADAARWAPAPTFVLPVPLGPGAPTADRGI